MTLLRTIAVVEVFAAWLTVVVYGMARLGQRLARWL